MGFDPIMTQKTPMDVLAWIVAPWLAKGAAVQVGFWDTRVISAQLPLERNVS